MASTPLRNDDPRHGTDNGYRNHGCRCERCRAAHAKVLKVCQVSRFARGLAEGDSRHGTEGGYGNWGCRCRACTDAHAATRRRRRNHSEERVSAA